MPVRRHFKNHIFKDLQKDPFNNTEVIQFKIIVAFFLFTNPSEMAKMHKCDIKKYIL